MAKQGTRSWGKRGALTLGAAVLFGAVQAAAAAPLIWVNTPKPAEMQHYYDEIVAAFEAANPGLKVDRRSIDWNDYDGAVDTLIASGTPPALWYPAAQRGFRFYAAQDAVMSIDAYVKSDHYDLSDFYPATLAFCQWQGRLDCLPADGFVPFIAYNRDLFDNAGIQAPPHSYQDDSWTWAYYHQIAKKLTLKAADGRITQYGLASTYDTRFLAYMFGGDWFDADAYVTGTPSRSLAGSDRVQQAFQYVTDLQREQLVGGDFNGGTAAMRYDYTWALGGFGADPFPIGLAPVPKPAPGEPQKLVLYPDQWAIMAGQNNPDAAWKLLKFIMAPEQMTKWLTASGFPLPARKSLQPVWADWVKKTAHLSDADLGVLFDAFNYAQVSASHAVMAFPDLYSTVIDPELQQLLALKKSPAQVAAEIQQRLDAKLAGSAAAP